MPGDLELSQEQLAAVRARDPLVLVLGAAGTGKSTAAIAAAHHALEREGTPVHQRVLFLTFSRTAVTQLVGRVRADRSLDEVAQRVDVSTFHSFALHLLRAFGGNVDVRPISRAQHRLFGQRSGEVIYDDLLPAALELLSLRSVVEVLRRRWALIVCDEFQDTNDQQWALLQLLGSWSRLLLMADPNQTIYDRLPSNLDSSMGQQRIDDVAVDARVIDLPPVSYRDPTNALPALADEMRRRKFTSPAVRDALQSGRLSIRKYSGSPEDHSDEVLLELRDLADRGAESAGVFVHGVDLVAELSTRLTDNDIGHVVAGLGEAHAEAIRAMAALVAYAADAVDHDEVRKRLAIFAAASRRQTPDVAKMLAGVTRFASSALKERLETLEAALRQAKSFDQILEVSCEFWPSLGIQVGGTAWQRAAGSFRVLAGGAITTPSRWRTLVGQLIEVCNRSAADALMSATTETTAPIRIMTFHQTKGREVDAAVLVFTTGDYFGQESSPYQAASRLLYVALTRARQQLRILLPPRPHSLVAPLLQYC